jgi:osmotically-inducible protein OsmY
LPTADFAVGYLSLRKMCTCDQASRAKALIVRRAPHMASLACAVLLLLPRNNMTINPHDSDIKQKVLEELKWDTRVDETEVGVQVHNSVVTLTGTVANWAKRLAARDAAHRVAGVRDVADDMKVKVLAYQRPDDTQIASAVRHSLKWHVLVPDETIQSTVTDGIVTLEGKVQVSSQKEDAALAVRHLDGVCAVINLIKIQATTIDPPKLRSAIDKALERHAVHQSKKLQFHIEGGKVTVSGPVESAAERQAVVGAVWGTRGVEAVVDQTMLA